MTLLSHCHQAYTQRQNCLLECEAGIAETTGGSIPLRLTALVLRSIAIHIGDVVISCRSISVGQVCLLAGTLEAYKNCREGTCARGHPHKQKRVIL